MNKRAYFQAALIVGGIAIYFISSPSIFEKVQSNARELSVVIDSTKEVPVIQAKSPEPISTAQPYPEPVEIPIAPVPAEPPVEFIEIINSCGPFFNGDCVNARSGPATSTRIVAKLRNGMVLRVAERVEAHGEMWYKIDFKEAIRYPERIASNMYVNGDYVRSFVHEGDKQLSINEYASSSKQILVDLSKQTLYAYDGNVLFMEEKVSTGIKKTPTPRGTFTIFKKTPSRYMQGPLPGISKDYYDLPGVPWNLYFTEEGAIFHGAYWHTSFGKVYSHGCVNLPVDKAEELYDWADLGTKVLIQD